MSRLQTTFVLGYHGCDDAVGEDILAGKTDFLHSKKDYDWLGPGAYFWEADPIRAWEWADDRAKTSGKVPFVVGAIIDLGNCLDATTREGAVALRAAYNSLRAEFEAAGDDLPINKGGPDKKGRYLDCTVVTHAHAMVAVHLDECRKLKQPPLFEPYDTVRGLFPEGELLYEGAGFWAHTHIQIAVVNLANIKGVFRVARPT